MKLLDLPLELFQQVAAQVVWLVGIQEAVRLRLVCKTFDHEIQRALFELPTFSDHDPELLPPRFRFAFPRRIERPIMNPAMSQRLILQRMKTRNARERPLCLAILRAIEYLRANFRVDEPDWEERCKEGLAIAATLKLPLHDLTCFLAPETLEAGKSTSVSTPSRNYLIPPSIGTIGQDALIAALSMKNFELVKRILESGVDGQRESCAFGSPVSVAALMGSYDIIELILDSSAHHYNGADDGDESDGSSENVTERIEYVPYFTVLDNVLQGAAAGNHECLVPENLPPPLLLKGPARRLEGTQSHSMTYCGLERAICTALRYRNSGVASLLLRHKVSEVAAHTTRSLDYWCSSTFRYSTNLFWLEGVAICGHEDYPLMQDMFDREDRNWPELGTGCLSHDSSSLWRNWINIMFPVEIRPVTRMLGVWAVQSKLAYVALRGQLDDIDTLLHHGADLNYDYGDRKLCIVVRLVRSELLDQDAGAMTLQHLIDKGVDLKKNHCGSQALAYALAYNQKMVRLLLDAGVSAREAIEGRGVDGEYIPEFLTAYPQCVQRLEEDLRTYFRNRLWAEFQ